MITLAEYAKACPRTQKAIYYAAGRSRRALGQESPVVKGTVLDRGL